MQNTRTGKFGFEELIQKVVKSTVFLLPTQTKGALVKLCAHYGFNYVLVCLTTGTGKTGSNYE